MNTAEKMDDAGTQEEPKGRRVTVDLTPAAAQEVDRLRHITGLKVAELFRHALTLLRIYINARSEGKEVLLVDPKSPETKILLEIPIPFVHIGGR